MCFVAVGNRLIRKQDNISYVSGERSMSLWRKLEEEVERGEHEALKNEDLLAGWESYFGFERNPFDTSPINPLEGEERIDNLVDREGILRDLARLLGSVSHANSSFNFGLVGPEGSGRKSISRTIAALARAKGFPFMIASVNRQTVSYPSSNSTIAEALDEDEWKLVVFEETDPLEDSIQYIKLCTNKRMLVISIWSPEQQLELVDLDREYYLSCLQKTEIMRMLETRIESSSADPSVITGDAVTNVAVKSMGVPRLALELAKASFETAFRTQEKPVNSNHVEIGAKRIGFADEDEDVTLSTKDVEVAKFLLTQREPYSPYEVKTKALVDDLDMNRVVAWRYLERLNQYGVLQKTYEGKAARYKLLEPGVVKLQLALYPRGARTAA